MLGLSDTDDYQPFGYVGRVPLYVTTLLVISYVAAMVALALLAAANLAGYAAYLPFESIAILQHFQFWRFLTYPFLNGPSIWFAVEMYMLYAFGREVERFIGRRSFIALYLALVLLVPCLLTAIGGWIPTRYEGSGTLNLGIFIAFVAIYPNVEILFTIKAKWIALVIVGIAVLQCLAAHALIELLILGAVCAGSWLFIKQLRGQIRFALPGRDYFRLRRSRRNLRAMPNPASPARPRRIPDAAEDVIESIDPLLDKIARSGLASLTAREREKLERARAELLKKPGR